MGCCSTGCGCSSSGGSDGLLKFSGFIGTAEGGGSLVSYLADAGLALDAVVVNPMNYPMALQRTLQGLSVNIGTTTLSSGQSVLVEVLRNGSAVPGFNVSYGVGDSGVKTNTTGRITYNPGDTFALRVTTAGFSGSDFAMFATVGVV